ncbi:MAG: hypothetical protein V5B35_01740 [Candidatus Accumulibacter necessarius]|jgi:hypothetical protein|uniref:hypothetical protein n=1 Tax=Candidatus Accumulibacter necessarius TaxID=2954386 RepID=UPI002FC30FD7
MKTSTRTTQESKQIPEVVSQFDQMPDQAVVDLNNARAISGRSRASLYRHFRAGDLTLIKVGNSTRVRVGELRRLIGAA